MDRKELLKTHKIYEENIDDWIFFKMAYDGGRKFVEYCLTKHDRESDGNWNDRKLEGINLNYCQSIINLFIFYLTEKPAIRYLGDLDADEQWTMFTTDCDLNGTNYNFFMNENQKMASAFGTVGILVDKAKGDGISTARHEIDNGIYPYCSVFTPPNILDWEFKRNRINNRPELVFLKLKESETDYVIWTKTKWERWYLPEKGVPERKEYGENPLDEIPFIWMYNIKSIDHTVMGTSDIVETSRIVGSIVRDISAGQEIIKYAAFPMLRKPMIREGDETGDDIVGVKAVLEFDPGLGEAGKPDWLESQVLAPIDAILKWIDKKVDEMFRIAHLSGVHGQRKSSQVASGVALRYEFQQLNSVLTQKSANMNEAEMQIIRLWLKWQNKEHLYKNIEIDRQKNFSIDDLTLNLEHSFNAIANIKSKKFRIEMAMHVAKQLLPDLKDDDFLLISDELDEAFQKLLDGEDSQLNEYKTTQQNQIVRDLDARENITKANVTRRSTDPEARIRRKEVERKQDMKEV